MGGIDWKKGLRAVPVIGDFVSDEQVDPDSIDTGYGEYAAPDQALAGAWKQFDAPAQNAQTVYDQALQRAGTSYQAGQLRDVDLGGTEGLAGADRLQGQQTQDLSRLDTAAAGRGPSAAQAQYAAGLEQARGQALALANTSRGAGRGAARLQALSNFGAQAGQNAAQAAALRAQEMQSAQAAYSSALAGARGQDTALADARASAAARGAGLRLQRDVSQEAASRGAFDSTQSAQNAYLNSALGAANSQVANANGVAGLARGYIDIAQGRAQTKQRQYELATGQEQRLREQSAGMRLGYGNAAAGALTRK